MNPALSLGLISFLSVALLGCAAGTPRHDFSHLTRESRGPLAEERQAVVDTATSLLGVPYRFGGSNPAGFDCSGFVKYVFKYSLGVSLPRHSRHQVRAGDPIKIAYLQPADLVFFRIERQKSLHVGIYIGNGSFIHAPSSGGTVSIQSLEMGYWNTRLLYARRVV